MFGEDNIDLEGHDTEEANQTSAAASLGLSKFVNVISEEQQVYPFTALMSDIGGAAGLFLGLNIMGLLKVKFYL